MGGGRGWGGAVKCYLFNYNKIPQTSSWDFEFQNFVYSFVVTEHDVIHKDATTSPRSKPWPMELKSVLCYQYRFNMVQKYISVLCMNCFDIKSLS